MQSIVPQYTVLQCEGSINITAEVIDGGVKLYSKDPFECTTEDDTIIVRRMTNKNISFFDGDICVYSLPNTRRIYVDNVDVTDYINQSKQKHKCEHIIMGVISLDGISIAGNANLQIKDASLLDSNYLHLCASNSAKLTLPPYTVKSSRVITSDLASVCGNISIHSLTVKAKNHSTVENFHIHEQCTLVSNDNARINVSVNLEANIKKHISDKSNITILYKV